MILVDSSVWIDWFNGVGSSQTDRLVFFVRSKRVMIGDLVLAEVLQGFRERRDYDAARTEFATLEPLTISDHRIAELAASHYRELRALGITIRKNIDTLIATRCIIDGIPLLYSDRDFDPFVAHLGLRDAMTIG